ncbi:MAG: branched-chain amino acid ABC transporter permease [Actinomycetes bacterium]
MQLIFQQTANGLVLGSAYALVALGLFLVYSIMHIPNFAHGEFFTLGAYIQYSMVTNFQLSSVSALAVTTLCIAALGLFVERTMFEWLRHTQARLEIVLVSTLALGLTIQAAILQVWGGDPHGVPTPLDGSIEIAGVRVSNYRAMVIVVALLIAVGLSYLVYHTALGKQMRAIAQNRSLAEVAGVPVVAVSAAAFAIGSALAGLAGGLMAPTGPLTSTLGFHPMLVAFVIVIVIGGGGRLSAVLLSGFAVATIETLTAAYISAAMRDGMVFIILVAFLIARPEGAIRQASAERARL